MKWRNSVTCYYLLPKTVCELPNKFIIYENPQIRDWKCAMLTFKSISFQISQLFNIVLKSKYDILQVIVWKWFFINQNSVHLCEKGVKDVGVLLPVVCFFWKRQ